MRFSNFFPSCCIFFSIPGSWYDLGVFSSTFLPCFYLLFPSYGLLFLGWFLLSSLTCWHVFRTLYFLSPFHWVLFVMCCTERLFRVGFPRTVGVILVFFFSSLAAWYSYTLMFTWFSSALFLFTYLLLLWIYFNVWCTGKLVRLWFVLIFPGQVTLFWFLFIFLVFLLYVFLVVCIGLVS